MPKVSKRTVTSSIRSSTLFSFYYLLAEERDSTYFFVYRHISAWRRCVLVPLEQQGSFSTKKRKGRPRYKADPDPAKEFEVPEDSLEVVKVEAIHGHGQDLNRAVWDMLPKQKQGESS